MLFLLLPGSFVRWCRVVAFVSLAVLCLIGTGRSEPDRPTEKPMSPWELQAQIQRDLVEKKLVHWKPGKDNDATPKGNLRCVAHDISGVWLRSGGFDHAQIKLFPMISGKYRVLFSTSGCEGAWRLERTATYQNGVLLLDRPVEEYRPATYNRLFTIRTAKGIRLISDVELRYRQKKPESLGDAIISFARVAPPKVAFNID